MKKIFISCPMVDKSDNEILNARKEILEKAKEYLKEDVEEVDSFFQGAPHEAKPLWFLGKSLQVLSTADVIVFGPDWDKYRGCKIEHTCAEEYGYDILYPEDYNGKGWE